MCIAARSCPKLCDGEIDVFRKALGKGVSVERVEHAIDGARRCTYRLRSRDPEA